MPVLSKSGTRSVKAVQMEPGRLFRGKDLWDRWKGLLLLGSMVLQYSNSVSVCLFASSWAAFPREWNIVCVELWTRCKNVVTAMTCQWSSRALTSSMTSWPLWNSWLIVTCLYWVSTHHQTLTPTSVSQPISSLFTYLLQTDVTSYF